jgi:hypothetical protein
MAEENGVSCSFAPLASVNPDDTRQKVADTELVKQAFRSIA